MCVHYRQYFPGLVSYNRFVELQQRVAVPMMLFLKTHCLGQSGGINFIDSTHIKTCHNRRIHSYRVLKAVAERGQCSIGWFYGFKLHLVINDKGEILSFYLTKGNVDDRNMKLMISMTEHIFGKLWRQGLYLEGSRRPSVGQWNTNDHQRKNMKGLNISQTDKILLHKRAIIECVNDELKNICKLQHTQHQSVNNFLINIIGTLCAYSFFPKKPSLNIVFDQIDNQPLLAA